MPHDTGEKEEKGTPLSLKRETNTFKINRVSPLFRRQKGIVITLEFPGNAIIQPDHIRKVPGEGVAGKSVYRYQNGRVEGGDEAPYSIRDVLKYIN